MDVLINQVLMGGERKDILVRGDRIANIGKIEPVPGIKTIDASRMAVIPSLVNAHSHAAMTLFRGLAEDLELNEWLTKVIWPREANLRGEDIYWGTRLAALEMISTGTTLCHDMYLDPFEQARAARDSGMRFVVNYALIDGLDEDRAIGQRKACEAFFDALPDFGPLVIFNLAAHSVYATTESSLRWLGEFAQDRGLSIHIHLSETQFEVDSCLARTGMRPAFYLDSLGLLSPRLLAAHALHLSSEELDLIASKGVALVHNPASNMKLSSGPAYDYAAIRRRGIRTLLGTDGAASNNGLDLFSDMKLASLLQKQAFGDPKRMPLQELFDAATRAGHEFFGDGAECLKAGASADFVLINIDKPSMTPCHNLVANLVYSGEGAAVDTVFCAGAILMEHGSIEGSGQVVNEARRRACSLAKL